MPDRRIVTALAAMSAYVGAHLLTLGRMPIVGLDEPQYTEPAWSLASGGHLGTPMFAGLHELEYDNVLFGRIYVGAEALSFKLFGLGPFQARLPEFLAGLVVIVLTYQIGRRLWNDRAGVFAAVALAFSSIFVMQTHFARPEMLLLVFFAASIYLALQSDEGDGYRGLFLAGLVAGLAADVHLNGVLVPFAVLAFVAIRTGRRRILLSKATAGALGTALGWAWWIVAHVAPNPSRFLDQWSSGQAGALPIQLLGTDPRTVLMAEPLRFLQASLLWWPLAWLLPLGAILGGVILLRHHRDRGVLAVLGLIATVFFLMVLFVANKAPTYVVLVWPFAALLVGRWLSVGFGTAAGSGMLVASSMASVVALSTVAVSAWQSDYDRFVGELRTYLPVGATVEGDPTWWFGLADHPYIADLYPLRDAPYGESIRKLGVEYVIVDDYFLDTVLRVQMTAPEAEVQAFLAQHAELIGVLQDPQYGRAAWGANTGAFVGQNATTRIYRVRP